MKKIVALLLALLLVCGLVPALAEERVAPEDRKETVTELDGGYESHFRNYAPKFWEATCDHPGVIERLDYTTDVYGETLNQWANVYLPYGYDAANQYNIIYFFHGTNETQESFICDELVKNAVDNMIDMGICEPFIMVCPTYYYDYENRATNHAVFVDEVRNDLMPAAETKYSTYAPTADDAGFTASREHRAFSGYSQGSGVCWTVSYRMLDWAKWFIPMSVASVNNLSPLKEAMGKSEFGNDVFFYICTGGKRDLAYEGTVELANAMIADPDFSFGTDSAVNNFYVAISKEIHQTLKGRFNLYNVFQDVLFK
ncbi:MAG: hypothetical protein IK099_00990 [Clostridia bacterium]|nr:hypothetical protein [Clostridia bacterium]